MPDALKSKKTSGGGAGKRSDAIRSTGITEFDRMLHGGLPSGATVLLAGSAGSGKTILASQWLFEGFRQFGERGIFISMTEYETSFVRNLREMSFFDADAYGPEAIHFLDLRQEMERLGLEDKEITRKDITRLCEYIFDQAAKIDAKRLVLDSVTAVGYRLRDPHLIRDFIFQLGGFLGTNDMNTFLTSEAAGASPSVFGVEEFISDGVIKFDRTQSKSGEPIRTLQITKLRAKSYDAYPVTFSISKDGFTFFPRTARDMTYQTSMQRIQSGVAGLDDMIGGGFFEGSSVLLGGASGTGKSIFAMQCAVGVLQKGGKALYVSFEESENHLAQTAGVFGWNLDPFIREGRLRLICHDPEERQLDELIMEVMGAMRELGPKLLVIDSISALERAHTDEAMRSFTSQVIMAAKANGVTTIFTAASAGLLGVSDTISGAHLSTITDNIILLRYIEIQSEMRHGLLILKMRGSDHDRKLREFVFSPKGIQVLYDFRGYTNILSGNARKVSKSSEDELRDLFVEILGPFAEKMFNDVKTRGLDMGNVQTLLAELGDQGIISRRRKDEFIKRAGKILQSSTSER